MIGSRPKTEIHLGGKFEILQSATTLNKIIPLEIRSPLSLAISCSAWVNKKGRGSALNLFYTSTTLFCVMVGTNNVKFSQKVKNSVKYGFLYENDHFNQAQAEFKKVLNGQSKQAQAEKKEGKKECVYHALREWLGTHTPKDGPFESQHCPSFTIRCNKCLKKNP